MAAVSKTKRNYTASLITSCGIILLVLYYILVYIPEKEKNINARYYRVLQRINLNLDKKISHYRDNVAPNYLKSVHKPEKTKVHASGLKLVPNGKDSLLYVSSSDRLLHLPAPPDTLQNLKGYHAAIPLDSILMPLMRWDSFSSFFILRKESNGKDSNKQGSVIFIGRQNNKNRLISLVPPDTLTTLKSSNVWQTPASMTIAGIPHKLFMYTLQISPTEEWALYGAVPESRYNMERKAVPSHALTFASLFFALLFLAFPFLKLILMSRQERLSKNDVAICFLSMFFSIALIVILFLDGYAYYGPDRNAEKIRLEKLNSAISGNLQQEIKQVVKQLRQYDTLPVTSNFINLKQEKLKPEECNIEPQKDSLQKDTTRSASPLSSCYVLKGKPDDMEQKETIIRENRSDTAHAFAHFVRVFWLDSVGTMNPIWTTKSTIDKAENVSQRDYFKKIKSKGGWSLPGVEEKFYLQSISSLAYGGKYTVISTKSNRGNGSSSKKEKREVIALTTKLASLHNPVLPPEYSFCVVDENGEILFHESENLNLNENLLEETGRNPALATALTARIPVHLNLDYQGTSQLMYVTPIKQLPMFLVTYVDFDARRISNVNIILQTLVFFLLYCSILTVLISLVVYGKKHFSKLSFGWLAFSWLWPKPERAPAYLRNLLATGATIFTIFKLTHAGEPVALFFVLLYAAIYVFTFSYITLHPVPLSALIRYWKNSYTGRLGRFLIFSAVIIAGFNLLCLIASQDAFMHGLWFQLWLILVLAAVYILSNLILYGIKKRGNPFRYKRYRGMVLFHGWLRDKYVTFYVFMLLGWLILTSAVPACFMFQVSYNLESARRIMHTQLHLASKLDWAATDDQRLVSTAEAPSTAYAPEAKSFSYTGFYHGTTYDYKKLADIDQAPDTLTKNTESEENAEEKHALLQIPQNVRTLALHDDFADAYNEPVESSTLMLNSLASISLWFLQPSSERTNLDYRLEWKEGKPKLTFNAPSLNRQDSLITLSSTLPVFRFPNPNYPLKVGSINLNITGIIFWFGILLLISLLTLFLIFLVNRIFNQKLLLNVRMGRLNKALLHPKCRNKLFVVSLPGARNIKETVRSLGKSSGHHILLVEYDLSKEDYEEVKGGKGFSKPELFRQGREELLVAYIKNFDYLPLDENSLRLKVKYLKALNKLKGTKVILESSLHPSYWEEKLKKLNEKEPASDDKEPATKYLLHQLLSLLADYAKMYNPLQVKRMPLFLSDTYKLEKKDLLIQFIKQECQTLSNLVQYENDLCDYVTHHLKYRKNIEKEDLIYRIQSLAQIYYRKLWSSCSEEEKYFLYDLAQDGLVNARNIGVLSSLMGKGLLIRNRDMRLKIMSESFKNFVLTVVNPVDALRYEKKMATGSRWNTYRTPFLLIIIGVGLFIFFTQKQAWLNIVAVVTALSTILALLPRLSVLIPSFMMPKDAK